VPDRDMPSPTEEQRESPEFEAVWQAIKTWDVNVPESYEGYCGANGSHVALILNALADAGSGASGLEGLRNLRALRTVLGAEGRRPVTSRIEELPEEVVRTAAQALHDAACSGDHPLSTVPNHAVQFMARARIALQAALSTGRLIRVPKGQVGVVLEPERVEALLLAADLHLAVEEDLHREHGLTKTRAAQFLEVQSAAEKLRASQALAQVEERG
jgi:hypothetical protein